MLVEVLKRLEPLEKLEKLKIDYYFKLKYKSNTKMIEINNEMLMVTTTVLYFIILIIEILILFKYCNVKPQEDNENDEKDD
jgi:hypothetical protein